MKFVDIRLIATDMDGTLLNSNHEVSPSFYPIFRKLKENGIIFVAASGRQYFNLVKALAPIKDEVIFAAENGSYIVYQDEEIHAQSMDPETVHELIKLARNIEGAFPIICGKKKAYVENNDADFIAKLKLYFERFEIVADLTQVEDDDFLKFTICDAVGSEKNSYPHYKKFHDTLKVKVSGEMWLDISHQLANKGVAMQVLQERFNISQEQTMVFGDYMNDLEMIQNAYFSYAMENGHPEIKKEARFQAQSNDENGVVQILAQVVDELDKVAAQQL